MRRRPVWLAEPTRFAMLDRRRARIAAALVALLVLLCLSSLVAVAPPADTGGGAAEDRADVVLYDGIVDAVRHGAGYYDAAASSLRAGGYPLRPFVTFRLPTLALLQAALPAWGVLALLYALAAAVLALWWRRLHAAFARPGARIVAALLLAGGMARFVQADLAPFHEVWAGLLIAASLAIRRRGRWVEAAALGLMALAIRETAALYVAVMAAIAWAEGERDEAAGWATTLAALAAMVAAHAWAVAGVVDPSDLASPGWQGLLGPGFWVQATIAATALSLAPAWLAAILVAVALVGWAGWRDPLGVRTLATLVAYAALVAVFARADTYYWVLLAVAPLPLGLAFAPDALADLARGALDRRRVTVTRTRA